jgi:hypothetical protein
MTAKVNLLIDQGASFSQELQLFDDDNNPLIVTHANGSPIYAPASEMRKSYQAINSVSFDTSLSNGSLILSMTPNTTSNITAGRWVWDAELAAVDETTVTRVVEGIVTVRPEVTR